VIPNFIKSYEASAAVGAYLIVKFSDAASSSKVAAAAANTDPLIGTTGKLGCDAAGQMLDVVRGGLGQVTLGGTVSAGDPLTSDADGKAVKATVAAATNVSIIGWADAPGVAGDVIDYLVDRSVLTKPAAS
jgi:hypothetical protein